ncbi:TonB-dependent receptor [Novosphingobium beihaiensis]|uniref:TonB-dependent receptor n=1 Tax=Novosphingobium beihaiensis TaxID=2930389 RepID=A0ABT0BUD5_9SPHN|nr:TonB-dependent receptor [Novosphingobium beihaiensis]MCJ2188680.1 TonB-dependent receptor [Novosphingobium beihaiensis]
MSKKFRTLSRILLTTTAAFTFPALAHAQDSADAGTEDTGGEIVVTALKRSTSLQKTPLAISAVTGDTLTSMGVSDTSQLSRVSPGLVLRESGLSGSRITIRNIRAAGESLVGLYYDEIPILGSAGVNSDAGGTLPAIDLFDVERVEVLRGPQGTLYGSSSMAGTVRLVLAKPDLNVLSGATKGQISSVAHGDAGFQTQAMINVPLIDDKLAIRAVGSYKNQPGFIDNITLGRDDVNEQRTKSGRVMLRAKPTEDLTLDLMFMAQDQKGSINNYFLASGSYKANFEALQPLNDRTRIVSGTAAWDLGPVTATLVGSHSYRDFNYSYDITAFFRTYAELVPSLADAFNAQAPSVANSSQITKTDTVELRFSSNGSDVLDWTAGLFYSNRKGDIQSNVVAVDPASGKRLAINDTTLYGQRVIGDGLKQLAGFGEVTWHATPELSVTGGLRYYDYTRTASGEVTVVDPLVGFSASPYTTYKTKENGFLYKGNVSYQITPEAMVYATVSSGQRPGGINQTVGLSDEFVAYRSDTLWNYEVGAKTQWFGRMLTINADIFRIDWDDMQTSGTFPNTNFGFITNAGRARAYGVEVETTLRPMYGLELQASGAYTDTELLEDQSNQNLVASGLKGDPIPFVSKVTAQGSAQYDWALSEGLSGVVRADVSYSGKSWTVFHHENAFQQYLPSFTTVNLRAGISGDVDQWSVALFVNNLTDEDAIISKSSGNIFGGLDKVRAISITPRTIGIDFSKHF